MKLQFDVTDVADDTVREQILSCLKAFNESQAGPSGYRPLAITLKNDAGEIVGGLWGMTSYGWLFVQLLVVPESARGQGVGSELLLMAEREAVARGCRNAWLDTFAFQARGFYEGFGYKLFGELADYPQGYARFFLQKSLVVA
ncbi:MAG: GNAT family N-acetyltransferase [Paludibacterium sp.]|uniref:GNAT family N-acetyltransferase n=1 Tax=Paludibacterium sp. TaxID=1917523 RepID=UPI0025FDFC72|nr:GNAT family N-acetyltransferase [Paludibacterium sp.]MBV8049342.1 GNAT family N-acetyltransferase [Paludibacterium sp.]